MSDLDFGPNRRAFLVAVAAASSVAAVAGLNNEAIAQAPADAAQNTWDLSWVDRLKRAKHRMVFDAMQVESGTPLNNAFFCMRDFGAVYKATDADMGIVIVVRHEALPIVFGDSIWQRLKLGDSTKMKDPSTGETAMRNPFVTSKTGLKNAGFGPGVAVDALMARGVTVLCCNQALMRFAGMLAKESNIPADQARTELVAALVPGTILVPSGIFGVARAQEAGCHYLRSA